MKTGVTPSVLHRIMALILSLALVLANAGLGGTVFASTGAGQGARPAQTGEEAGDGDLFLPLVTNSGTERQPRTLPVGTLLIFGPQDYVRTAGPPNLFTASFAVQNPNSHYMLRIDNGGRGNNGETIYDRVTSAVVRVNGGQIAGPGDFNPNVASIEKPVTLQAQNELTVEVRGKPGSGFTLQILGIDPEPPTIDVQIDPPANANGWHNGDVTVSFTCADAASGVESCTDPVTLATEGADQEVAGTAVDHAHEMWSERQTSRQDLRRHPIESRRLWVSPLPGSSGASRKGRDPSLPTNRLIATYRTTKGTYP